MGRAASRIVKVRIANKLLIQMFTQGWSEEKIKCVEGLPEGAELVGSYADRNMAVYLFRHDSFDEVLLGDAYPELTPVFMTEQSAP